MKAAEPRQQLRAAVKDERGSELVSRTLCLDGVSLRAGSKASGRLLCSELGLRVLPGERWVLLGPNGAGKSTLLMAVAGVIQPAEGQIVLGEQPLCRWPPAKLAAARAWCPQFWHDPFPVSAWETVASPLLATHPRGQAAAIKRLARRWLGELDVAHLADHDVRTLSGGERQRVALATAFAQGAPLLLLDEPTAHLDWAHQSLLRRLLEQWSLRRGTALVAVHDLNLAWSLATHALLFDGRGGIRCGRREDVLSAEALAHAYGLPVSILEDRGARWYRIDLEGGA